MMTDQEFEKFIESDSSSIEWTLLEGTMQDFRDKVNKVILKTRNEAYDKGYKAGANQKDNKPCVCGFWGEGNSWWKHSYTYLSNPNMIHFSGSVMWW